MAFRKRDEKVEVWQLHPAKADIIQLWQIAQKADVPQSEGVVAGNVEVHQRCAACNRAKIPQLIAVLHQQFPKLRQLRERRDVPQPGHISQLQQGQTGLARQKVQILRRAAAETDLSELLAGSKTGKIDLVHVPAAKVKFP